MVHLSERVGGGFSERASQLISAPHGSQDGTLPCFRAVANSQNNTRLWISGNQLGPEETTWDVGDCLS